MFLLNRLQILRIESQSFELQLCRIEGLRADVFESLLHVLKIPPTKENEARILDVVKPLCVFVARLPDYIASGWFALLAPHGTPKPILNRLNKELAAAIADPAVRARFLDIGAEPIVMPTDDSSRFLSGEIAKWRDVIIKAGIPPIE